jgi:hypothetical protein
MKSFPSPHAPHAKTRARKSTPKAHRTRGASPRPALALVAEPPPDADTPNTVSPRPEPPAQITDPPL